MRLLLLGGVRRPVRDGPGLSTLRGNANDVPDRGFGRSAVHAAPNRGALMVATVYVCEHCDTQWSVLAEAETCETECAQRRAARYGGST